MVVGGMVGAGVFSLPRNFAQVAGGVYGALIAWTIAGAGMYTLALVFQNLANRKPNLASTLRQGRLRALPGDSFRLLDTGPAPAWAMFPTGC